MKTNSYYLGLWTYCGEDGCSQKIQLNQAIGGNLADPWTREEMHRKLDFIIDEVGRYIERYDLHG